MRTASSSPSASPTAPSISTDLMLVSCGVRPETGSGRRGRARRPDAASSSAPTCASPADPSIRAIGDCAEPPDGWQRAGGAGVGAGRPTGQADDRRCPTSLERDEVASRGRPAQGGRRRPRDAWACAASGAGSEDRVICARRTRRLVVTSRSSSDDDRLVGFTCLGAPEVSASLSVAFERRTPLPVDPATLLHARRPGHRTRARAGSVADADPGRRDHLPLQRRHEERPDRCVGRRLPHRRRELAAATRATTGCGGCTETVCGLVDWLTSSDSGDESTAQPVRNTTSRRVLPQRNIRPDPTKCCLPRFPDMDEQRTEALDARTRRRRRRHGRPPARRGADRPRHRAASGTSTCSPRSRVRRTTGWR